MTVPLPPHPSLENLKKRAKTLRRACQSGDSAALERVRAVQPRLGSASPRLADCQLTLAREYGFESWRALKAAVESANQDLPDQFVDIACLCHDDPHYDHRSFHQRAHQMLRDNPWLADATIWSAAAAGNSAAVGALLDEDPGLVNRPGPHGWVPLICACYSRVKSLDPKHSTFEVAKILLDRGADPNAFTLKRNADERLDQTPRRFTALTGVFGGGSTGLANQPPHPRWRDLAEMLLEHGAVAADEQALVINPDASLEILLRHGLRPDAVDGDGITLMGRQLANAARSGNRERVDLLLSHAARTDENVGGKTVWEYAMEFGHREIANTLEEAGAPVSALSDVDRFVALCMAADEPGVRAMLEDSPDLRDRAPKDMVHRAVHARRREAVKLVMDLGFDPNYQDDNPPLCMAGVLSERDDILRTLLDGGASLKVRDVWYDSTGIGWADFFDRPELRDRLLNEADICLFDALDYGRLDRVPDILARDPDALERPFAKCVAHEPRPEQWQTPLVRMVARGDLEAVRVLLEHGADAGARHPDGCSLLELARDHAEIEALLRNSQSGGIK